ncbi:MAG: cytochrome BD ubiquinol oxidase subunit II [Hydrogenophaga sp.]|uniref:cytochrome d ubiquinol oxidase subunit II n=1 Tax=Hydrogenophaga sp. TaxID=1904254 RepID=UPI00168E498E|nr:cytochrome d ubiquinol oxidase subunit II [Hydrogenophaga sp.]NIM41708.1 cytochrome BD ubiquinol oxidase subunit II [Hydrogenophaga sp.]NIN27013.1 cytochrome BD ubiquinol oxidase subunit II [Hydrogenophaga sp.]NIN31714.1 cytochrome BD ubiquinol oxidase subunit II [Hydrogenophaga sp.]NIN55958.1 cytochrome BD ubiquinol oxidase subunit II [Hydrogenophaga sp.]NIO52085.1 cytochrome BD ubiquinol oxidase subunit II [Hydrogenophaga sp.]
MTWAEFLPLIFMAVMGLALLAYVVLDGYDLGVGLLLPLGDEVQKDTMVSSIGPFWDANETWLVLGVGVLLVAFPKAHGLVLQALYLPAAIMIVGLILRGVAFDFRVKAPTRYLPFWNRAFFAGSLAASASQGWMLGSYITGFDTGVLGLLFSLGIAITLPAAYLLLGAGWLIMKTDGELQQKAVRWARGALWPMGVALLAISVATPLVSPAVFEKWFGLPQIFALLPVPLICAAAFFAVQWVVTRPNLIAAGYGWLVFVNTVLIFVLAFFGLAYSIFPDIVIGRLTLWDAAAATSSLTIIFIGVAITLPMIIVYTIYLYRVFWGKAHPLSYG